MKKSFGLFNKMYSSFRLWIDRVLAGRWYKQLIIAFVPFLAVLLLITSIYTTMSIMGSKDDSFFKNIPKAFVDMTNPETVHNSVYDTIPIHQEIVHNQTTITSPSKETNSWAIFIWVVVYVLGAVVFTGLLIATITNIWRARADKFRRGKVDYLFF